MKWLSVVAVAASALAINPIEVVGNKFYDSITGERFMIKGVAYQQKPAYAADAADGASFVDPLADGDACKRDIEYLKKLQTNTVRVYAVSSNQSHDECMAAFADAGIYVVADLAAPGLAITNSVDSWEWSVKLFDRYKAIIDDLGRYDNTLGFFAGNEATTAWNTSDASAFVKAAVRDLKQYINDNLDTFGRAIPVGYATTDADDIRVRTAHYFACGDAADRADFFGISMYEWCGASVDFDTSGYKNRTEDYADMPIPVFFAEYGCLDGDGPRPFNEVAAIYSDDMTDVWLGGIVYTYQEQGDDYGLVSVSAGNVSTLDDFINLLAQMAQLPSPSYAPRASASAEAEEAAATVACPTVEFREWNASPKLPPTPDADTCACVVNSLECVVEDFVREEDYNELFGMVCGSNPFLCGAINVNTGTGEYGGMSFCSIRDKVSFVLDAFYQDQGKAADACDWYGAARIVTPAPVDDSCKAKIANLQSFRPW